MRLWLSGHLNILILIPLFSLLSIGCIDAYRALTTLFDTQNTIQLSYLLDDSSAIVHEMQKERGISAGYIGSKGKTFNNELTAQHSKLDKAISRFKLNANTHNFDSETTLLLSNFTKKLTQLNDIRTKIKNQAISLPELLKYYSEKIRQLIDLISVAAHHVEDRQSSQQFETLFSLSNVKENSGKERATLNNLFNTGMLSVNDFSQFTLLVAKQDAFIYSAKKMADSEFLAVLDKLVSSKENKAVQSYRAQIKGPNITLSVDPQKWFSASTARIELLRTDEMILLSQIHRHADEINSSAYTVIVLISILLLLTIYIGYIISRTLSDRAKQTTIISTLMKQVVQEKDLSNIAEIKSHCELGGIAKNLNQLIESMRTDFIAFEHTAQEFSSATYQTSMVTKQSNGNLSTMRSDVTELTSVFNNMNQSIENDIETISQAAEMAQQVSTDATEGSNTVKTAVVEISEMAEDITLVGKAIHTLNDRVIDIEGMVDVIRSVADQTNLLALNAAIEAARAGDQGRGFAVVADEVRTLAKRTQESTEQISRIVEELTKSSSVAFDTIEKSNTQANNSVEMISGIDITLSNITDKISNLNEMTQSISNSATEQISMVSTLGNSVNNIDTAAEENAQSGNEIEIASERLTELSLGMIELIKAYKTI